jgi:hypothetical protein
MKTSNGRLRLLVECGLVIIVLSGTISASPVGWRNPVMVTYVYQDHTYGHPSIAPGPGNKINVVLRKLEGGDTRCYELDIYQSTNTGVNWAYRGGYPNFPAITSHSTDIMRSGNNIYIVYQGVDEQFLQNKIYYSRSTNSGDSWPTSPIIIAPGIHPRICVDGDTLHCIYAYRPDENGYDIYRRESTNQGTTWPNEQRITNIIRNSWHPATSINANTIHLVWADNRVSEQNYEIFYDKSTDNGNNWIHGGTSGLHFSMDGYVSEYPDIVAYTDPNYEAVHVVWMDDNYYPGPGIYYRRSTDNGSNWNSAVRLLENGRHPAITADTRGLYIVCEKNSDIWYIESTNWGLTWSSPVNLTVSGLLADSFPDIQADEMGRHVVFT